MRKSRNYLKTFNEFINVNSPLEMKVIGSVHYDICYPMIEFYHHSKAKKDVVLLGGVHGNESIGVKVMLRFLQEFQKEWLDSYNFYVFPIVNPFGYAYNIRGNGAKYDINRHAYTQKPYPIETVEFKILEEEFPESVNLCIDVHQNGKKNFYCYEKSRPDKESLATFGMQEIKKQKIAVEEASTIYGEKCIQGVVNSIKDKSNTIEDYMFSKGAMYSLTLENPDKPTEEELVIGSLAFLRGVLNKFKEIK